MDQSSSGKPPNGTGQFGLPSKEQARKMSKETSKIMQKQQGEAGLSKKQRRKKRKEMEKKLKKQGGLSIDHGHPDLQGMTVEQLEALIPDIEIEDTTENQNLQVACCSQKEEPLNIGGLSIDHGHPDLQGMTVEQLEALIPDIEIEDTTENQNLQVAYCSQKEETWNIAVSYWFWPSSCSQKLPEEEPSQRLIVEKDYARCYDGSYMKNVGSEMKFMKEEANFESKESLARNLDRFRKPFDEEQLEKKLEKLMGNLMEKYSWS